MARKSRKNQPQAEALDIKSVVYDTTGYTRISVDDEKSEDSIENQAALIRDYVKDKPDLNLRGVITTDVGYSGTDFDRPGYAELMEGITDGTTRCVVVKDLSRLGRTYIEVGELLFDTFPAYNVRFISVNDNYDSFADDAGRKKLLILFKNLVNHMYSKDLGRKIRAVHDVKKRRGELAGNTPYGYKRGADGKQLAIDEDAAVIVRCVFDMRLRGCSASGIAKALNADGVPSPQKRRYLLGEIKHEKFSGEILWGAEMICRMLKNETYTGLLVQGKYSCDGKRHSLLPSDQWIRHENTHAAIIPRERFDAVQTLLAAASEKYRKLGLPSPENAYVGKLYCVRCGGHVQRTDGGARGRVIYYYSCRHCRDELSAELGVKRLPSISRASLDAAVSKTLRAHMNVLIEYDTLIPLASQSNSVKQKLTELKSDKAKLEKDIVGADKTIEAAYTHHLDGLLDFREYELVRERTRREKEEKVARLQYAELELQRLDARSNKNSYSWRELFVKFNDFDVPTKELVWALIYRITLEPLTNEVEITFNYADSFGELRGLLMESGVIAGA